MMDGAPPAAEREDEGGGAKVDGEQQRVEPGIAGHEGAVDWLDVVEVGSPHGAASFAGTSLLPAYGTRYLAAHGVAFSLKVEHDFQDPKLVSPRLPLPYP